MPVFELLSFSFSFSSGPKEATDASPRGESAREACVLSFGLSALGDKSLEDVVAADADGKDSFKELAELNVVTGWLEDIEVLRFGREEGAAGALPFGIGRERLPRPGAGLLVCTFGEVVKEGVRRMGSVSFSSSSTISGEDGKTYEEDE